MLEKNTNNSNIASSNGVMSESEFFSRTPNERSAPEVNKKNKKQSDEQVQNFKLPTFSEMAKSMTQSATIWAVRGFKKVDETELKKRTEICGLCEFWSTKGFSNTGRCMKCGCSTWAKLRMATEKCPIGKW